MNPSEIHPLRKDDLEASYGTQNGSAIATTQQENRTSCYAWLLYTARYSIGISISGLTIGSLFGLLIAFADANGAEKRCPPGTIEMPCTPQKPDPDFIKYMLPASLVTGALWLLASWICHCHETGQEGNNNQAIDGLAEWPIARGLRDGLIYPLRLMRNLG